jgi:hypothetical protein
MKIHFFWLVMAETIFCGLGGLTPQFAFCIFILPQSAFLARQAKAEESIWWRSQPDRVGWPVNLLEGNRQPRFYEVPGPTDIGLKSCGAAGKPGG